MSQKHACTSLLTLLVAAASSAALFSSDDTRPSPSSARSRRSDTDSGPKSRDFVPTDAYDPRTIEGWKVLVNKRLLEADRALGDDALRLLEAKLYDIRRVLPPRACQRLQQVPIWLGINDGHAPCAEYHVSKAWLTEHGYNPDKAKAVEIGNASRFLKWTLDQPTMVLHELAHAYHDLVLGHAHAELRATYAAAVAAGSYERVLRFNGRVERAYALENDQEYFAEATEAYFGTNDFYPFVRAELKQHDPRMFELLEKIWNE
jgi:hypothetical protein